MTLTDERIDRMRDTILTEVDADATRRGRRVRRTLGAAAAACFVVVIGGVGVTALNTADGPIGSNSADQGSSVEVAPPPDNQGPLDEEAVPPSDGRAVTPETDPGRREGPDLTQQPDGERDVVVTGTADVSVADPREAAAQLSAWVRAREGRVDARSEQEYGTRASANLTIRVPVALVDAALAELDEIGDVTRVDVAREDVASQRRDLDARIDALEVSIKRLESILAEADGSNELLATERAIQERQGQLESLEAQRSALSEQTALSTITVNLVQEGSSADESPADRDGFLAGLREGWDALVDFSIGAARVAGVLLPWLAVPVAALVLWRVTRRIRRR